MFSRKVHVVSRFLFINEDFSQELNTQLSFLHVQCTCTVCQNGAYLEQFQGKKCVYTCLAKNPLLNFVLNHSMMEHKERAYM